MTPSIVDHVTSAFISYPDKTAVRQQNIDHTYNELYEAINSIASFLIKTGLRKGDSVAVLLENSFNYIAIYYAVLKSGGVVVPLNTAAKSNDLCNWIDHSGAKWLFIHEKSSELDSIKTNFEKKLKFVVVNGMSSNNNCFEFNSVLSTKTDTTFPGLEPHDIATIIYTSGTTGQPKGVTLSHQNLISNMNSILEYMPVSNDDRCLNVLPFYYSYGNSVLHIHMMSGATLLLENSFYSHMQF